MIKLVRGKIIVSVIVFFLGLAAISGCANQTQPNIPYQGPYPPSVMTLGQEDSLLVAELGKLPDIQDGITDTEAKALDRVAVVHSKASASFNRAFKIMYHVGIPNVRKYCSLLEAFFWYALKNDNEKMIEYLDNFDWRNIDVNHPFLESAMVQRLLSPAWDFNDRIRWNDPKTAMERLNSPELLNYYINQRIYYKQNRTNSHTPTHTYTKGWGDCDDLAVFGDYILSKAGYNTHKRYVHWTSDNRGHVGTVIRMLDGNYFLVVDFRQIGNLMSGPYRDISDVDIKLSCGHSFHSSGWWQPPH